MQVGLATSLGLAQVHPTPRRPLAWPDLAWPHLPLQTPKLWFLSVLLPSLNLIGVAKGIWAVEWGIVGKLHWQNTQWNKGWCSQLTAHMTLLFPPYNLSLLCTSTGCLKKCTIAKWYVWGPVEMFVSFPWYLVHLYRIQGLVFVLQGLFLCPYSPYKPYISHVNLNYLL